MKGALHLLAMLLLLSASVRGEELEKALDLEMQRSLKRLQTEGLPAPYYLRFEVIRQRTLEFKASFGALDPPSHGRGRWLILEMRLGSPEFDTSHFVSGWNYGPDSQLLPLDDDVDAIRHAAWLALDRAYKNAAETLAKKMAYRESRNILEPLPDLSKEKVKSVKVPLEKLQPKEQRWAEAVRAASAVFKNYPRVRDSQIELSFHEQDYLYMDAEGRRSQWPDNHAILMIRAESQSDDGMLHQDYRQVRVRREADVPDAKAMASLAKSLAEQLTHVAEAPLWEGVYLGPVLLEGQAAGEFLHQMLALNLSAPRAPWVQSEWARDSFSGGAFAKRLGLRVVSPVLDVIDDPLAKQAEGVPLYGAYEVDDEGIPAGKVVVIEKGILKNLLMSRAPVKERKHSTGHGRAGWGSAVFARPSSLFVKSRKAVNENKLRRELLSQAKAFGLEHALVIRRLGGQGDAPGNPSWLLRVRVSDGKEEAVRGAVFHGVTLRALRDIIVTGKKRSVYNHDQDSQIGYGGGVPASIITPDLLLSEMELKKTTKEPDKVPVLKHPYFSKE